MRRFLSLALYLIPGLIAGASEPARALEPEILAPAAPAAAPPTPAPSDPSAPASPTAAANPSAATAPAAAPQTTQPAAAAAAAPAVPGPEPSTKTDSDSGVLALVRQKLPAAPATPPGATTKSAPNSEAADRAALAAYYAGTEARTLWTDANGLSAAGTAAAAELALAGDWGLSAKSFETGDLAKAAPADAEIKLSLAVLKYARHARGGRISDPAKQLSSYLDRTPQVLDPATVLEGAAKAADAQAFLRSLHPQHPQFEKLRQRYLAAKAAGDAEAGLAKTLLANMELWRWIPTDMGKLHVWVNLPEYTIRVMKDGQPIHEERVISGLKDKQTPVFSDEMETVVFKPAWGIPESIKVKDIYPSLARGGAMAKRYNIKVAYNGKVIDPATVDWSTADIRKFEVYQPSGEGNMMGVLKFLFPNKHQTYMHDTPDKSLFNQTERTFSHGCMRVRNPVRLAEVVLAEDKGWDGEKVAELIKAGPENNMVALSSKIPVHITYFTAWIGEDGKETLFKDMYGHEQRVKLALDGRFAQIARGPDHLAPVKMTRLPPAQGTKALGEMMHGFANGH